MIIRHPHPEETDAIRALFEDEVHAGKMLPRSPETIRNHTGDWLIMEDRGQIIGCVSLVFYNPSLCEVRSLAVHPARRGNGIAARLVEAAVSIARARGMHEVLVLTRAPRVFERLGFRRDFLANFPEKVWRDCAPCPFRQMCDEIALIYPLRQFEEVKSGV